MQQHHPQRYAALYTWLLAERSNDRVPGSHHDTLDWLALATEPAVLDGRMMFEAATMVWMRGLQE